MVIVEARRLGGAWGAVTLPVSAQAGQTLVRALGDMNLADEVQVRPASGAPRADRTASGQGVDLTA